MCTVRYKWLFTYLSVQSIRFISGPIRRYYAMERRGCRSSTWLVNNRGLLRLDLKAKVCAGSDVQTNTLRLVCSVVNTRLRASRRETATDANDNERGKKADSFPTAAHRLAAH